MNNLFAFIYFSQKTLEREVRTCQGLIIWTDCDREGENIGFEIIKVCTDVKPNLKILRAKFSEITGPSIFRALNNLGQPNKNVSDAVDVRQELDLRTGFFMQQLINEFIEKKRKVFRCCFYSFTNVEIAESLSWKIDEQVD